MKPKLEPLMTLDQVAHYLNVNQFTVYRLLENKELPAFKVGNQWRFRKRLVDKWLTDRSINVKKVRRKTARVA